ncbi:MULTISPECIES: hypothetical protein [unclassified Paenibacillus]|uniref:hypothetical protein n=1 Tax=unclassified Paenibacillus TaxID=185978 RepID=UPI0009A59FDD|nr:MULTISPECIES: hypothetical protein [unclassified Paenibacillus]SLK12984.1 hypothetical protein SAMN06272722_10837 [Paenibacillus sp. RU5A]SOC72825.1 hypothetical protein SAMN05880581_10837 [Paenibacillus sp. RU26A]SOC75080.1 hypothetical protein SAMN05880586_10837 [Paenibacillus sp. RU5M]
MDFPPWMQRAIHARLDEVTARIEHDPERSRVREGTDEAFEVLFAGKDVEQTPEYIEWENRYIVSKGIENEQLYMQGLRDGIQLTVSLLGQSMPEETDTEA